MAVPTIDLGLVSAAHEANLPTPGRRRRRPDRRWLTALLLVLMPLSVGPGEVAFPSSPFVALFTTGFVGTFRLTPDGLYAVVIDGSELVAYRRDGSTRWTARLALAARRTDVRLDLAGDLLLVTHATVTAGSAEAVTVVGAYAAGTGELRWQREGSVLTPIPAGAQRVLLRRPLPQPPGFAPDAEHPQLPSEFLAVEVRTGAVAWTMRLGSGEWLDPPWLPFGDLVDRLVVLDTAGRLTVRDLATGRVRATRTLPGPPGSRYAQSAGGLVVVAQVEATQTVLTGYDPETLVPRWMVAGLPVQTSVLPCGPVLCLAVADGLRALDPATGGHLWAGGWLRAVSLAAPWPAGYLLGEQFLAVGSTELMGFLVVARTGETAIDMRGWRPTSGASGAPQLIVHRRLGGTRVWFARVRPERRRVEPFGVLDGVREPCSAVGDLLACPTTERRVRVWRIRK